MDLQLTSAKVIVTAGASGIGLKITERLLAEGASVYICDIDVAALEAAKEKNPSLMTGVCDVSKRDSVANMVEQAVQGLGGLDCLINNAGIAGPTAHFMRLIQMIGIGVLRFVSQDSLIVRVLSSTTSKNQIMRPLLIYPRLLDDLVFRIGRRTRQQSGVLSGSLSRYQWN